MMRNHDRGCSLSLSPRLFDSTHPVAQAGRFDHDLASPIFLISFSHSAGERARPLLQGAIPSRLKCKSIHFGRGTGGSLLYFFSYDLHTHTESEGARSERGGKKNVIPQNGERERERGSYWISVGRNWSAPDGPAALVSFFLPPLPCIVCLVGGRNIFFFFFYSFFFSLFAIQSRKWNSKEELSILPSSSSI